MTTLRQAAQQALEALEKVQRDGDAHWPITIDEAITALREVLAQEDETREMLRTLGFGSQCPESIGITLRRWRDGYAAALAQQEQQEQEPVDAEAALRCALAQRDWAFKQLQAQPNRRTGLPHCERSCEANAFQIEIRRLKALLDQPRRLTDDQIGRLWFEAKIPGLNEADARRLIRAVEAAWQK
jgi:hypothetical protein